MSFSRKIGKYFFNLKIPQVGRSMEYSAPDIIRDGVRNDFPDYLIETVYDSPYGAAAIDKVTRFVHGRSLSADAANTMVNKDETWEQVHKKIAQDLAIARRFAIKIIPNAGGNIDSIYHIPFEAVRYVTPDENTGCVDFAAVNYKFNQQDYKVTETKYFPLFNPVTRFDSIRDDIESLAARFARQDYYGHIWFYTETNPKNRVYSRPTYFACHPELRTDAKIGVFHERNTDNNFFLGGILSVVGDPEQGIYKEGEDTPYTTVGEEFQKQLGETFSGAKNAGRMMIDWVATKDDATTVTSWPGSSNHEQYAAQEIAIRERIAISFGVPKILFGIPTAGKLGDNQEIRNAINFTNENTSDLRTLLEEKYSVIGELLPDFSGEVEIVKIRDWTDLHPSILKMLTPSQKADYLLEKYGIELDEMEIEEMEAEQVIEIENADLPDSED